MTNTPDHIEIVTSVQRGRRWTAAEKMRLVEATFALGMTVSLVARQNGIAPWRETCTALHLYARIIGKYGLAHNLLSCKSPRNASAAQRSRRSGRWSAGA
jgi:hypothetical protein